MPDTKPFMSFPVWSNPRQGRQFWGRDQYHYKDVNGNLRWSSTIWKYFMQQRTSVRIIKILIVCALLMTCIVNIKLAIEAKVKYERHVAMFVNPFDKGDLNEEHLYAHEFPQFSHVREVIDIELLSSKDQVKVEVNGELVYQDVSANSGRGLHVVVLNEHTAAVTASFQCDTFMEGEDTSLREFVNSIHNPNRILIFAVKDEASLHMQETTKKILETLGSTKVYDLKWRSMWAFVSNKRGQLYAEELTISKDHSTWAEPVRISTAIKPVKMNSFVGCHWPTTPQNKKREIFCSRFDGYSDLCSCENDFDLDHKFTNFSDNKVYDVPVAVIASNRPHYLYRMLKSLFAASGVNPEKVVVFIDGYFEEPMEVTKLMGVKGIFHTPVGTANARVSQNYKASLTATFNMFPDAKYAIILEDDLDVSTDFFRYFSQTLHLTEDPFVYCISAWNDHGYHHSCQDPTLLYRIEGFPGLGWLLTRKLFEEELEPFWPSVDRMWDWDMWMRTPRMRKNRECIIPDVSRTFHFGIYGLNMNSYFHQQYFSKHKINLVSDAKLKDVNKLTKDNYEKLMHVLVRDSVILDHSKSPCGEDFITDKINPFQSYVMYLNSNADNVLNVFQSLFKCLKLWDLDVRGLHKATFRTFVKESHIVFVAYPISPYSIYKPVNIVPVDIQT